MNYQHFHYPYIFDKDGMMRDPKPKSEIIDEVKRHTTANNAQVPDQVKYVIDGGYLLHKIFWDKGENYDDICNTYIRYILKHYGNVTTIVFDGYDDIHFQLKTPLIFAEAKEKLVSLLQ